MLARVPDQNWPQFGHVTISQDHSIEMTGPGQMGNVLPVSFDVAAKFRKDQIISVQDEETQMFEALWEQFRHSALVIFRNGSYGCQMNLHLVLSRQSGTVPGYPLQVLNTIERNQSEIVEIIGAPRKPVGGDDGETSDAVQFEGVIEQLIQLVQEAGPPGGRDSDQRT